MSQPILGGGGGRNDNNPHIGMIQQWQLPHFQQQQQQQQQQEEQQEPSIVVAQVGRSSQRQQVPAAPAVPMQQPPPPQAAAADPRMLAILEPRPLREPPVAVAPVAAPIYPTTLQAMTKHKDHPLRMKLEWDEIERAELIRDAIRETAGLDNVTDFWCAQYALICKDVAGDVLLDNVLERVENLQVFRNQYDIRESYQQGCRALRRLVELCPNFILGFYYDSEKGNYVVAENPANIPGEDFVDRSRDFRDFVVGYYYLILALCPDFQSIHKGPSVMIECKDMGWSTRHSMKVLYRAVVDGLSCIPFDVNSSKFYNTGMAGAVFNTMRRALLDIVLEPLGGEEWNGHAQNRIEIGLTCSEGLDSVFLVPDAATAQQRTLRNLEESLRLRFTNEESFSLQNKIGKTNWQEVPPFTDDEVEAIYDARRRG